MSQTDLIPHELSVYLISKPNQMNSGVMSPPPHSLSHVNLSSVYLVQGQEKQDH